MSENSLSTTVALAVQAGVVPLLAGPPGTGKSATVAAVARALGYELIVIRPAQIEPADLTGYPVADPAAQRLRFLPGSWFGRAERCPTIVFLDELYAAAPSQQNACGGVTFDRMAGELRVPEHTRFVMAGNPPTASGGGADVGTELIAMLANRCAHLDAPPAPVGEYVRGLTTGWPTPSVPRVDPDALAAQLPVVLAELGSFLTRRPELAYALPKESADQSRPWPSYRSWELAARCLAASRVAHEPAAGALLAAGLVGVGPASEFVAYLQTLDLPDPRQVRAGVVPCPVDPTRADRTRVTLDAVVAATIADAAARPAERETLIRQTVAVLVAVASGGRPDLVGKAAHQLDRLCGGARPAELAALFRQLAPTLATATGASGVR